MQDDALLSKIFFKPFVPTYTCKACKCHSLQIYIHDSDFNPLSLSPASKLNYENSSCAELNHSPLQKSYMHTYMHTHNVEKLFSRAAVAKLIQPTSSEMILASRDNKNLLNTTKAEAMSVGVK